MHVPIERICHDSTESNSPETGLLPDEGEFQEGHEQHCTSKVAHSRESFSLTELLINYCSASAKYSMFFNLTYGEASIFRPIYIMTQTTSNH